MTTDNPEGTTQPDGNEGHIYSSQSPCENCGCGVFDFLGDIAVDEYTTIVQMEYECVNCGSIRILYDAE